MHYHPAADEANEEGQRSPIEVETEPEVGPLGRTLVDPVDQAGRLVPDATVLPNLTDAVCVLYPGTGLRQIGTSPLLVDTMHPATPEVMQGILPSEGSYTFAVELSGDDPESLERFSGEVVRVGGTPYHLHYRTDRVPGRVVSRRLSWDARGQALGGWRRDQLHVYDPSGRALLLRPGDERRYTRTTSAAQQVRWVFDDRDNVLAVGPPGLARRTISPSGVGLSYAYDGFAEPSSYATRVSGADVHRSEFMRDKLGRITQRSESVDGVTSMYEYTYDGAGRLKTASRDGMQVAAYDYGLNGNPLDASIPPPTFRNTSTTYDDQGRLLTHTNAWFSFTASGEPGTTTENDATATYIYDAAGNLAIFEVPDRTRIDYLIDERVRRVGKKANGSLVQAFAYSNQRTTPAAELDGAGNVAVRLVYGDRLNVPEYMVKDGVTYQSVTDHLGSPLGASDGALHAREHSIDRSGRGEKFRPESRRVTIAIGLDYSETPALRPLKFASADARRVAGVFESLGFESSVLTDGDVDAVSLLRSLADEVRVSRRGDALVIYFAGHGVSDRNGQPGIVLPGGSFPGILPLSVVESALKGYRGDALIVLDGCAKQLSGLPPFPKPAAHVGGRLAVFSGASAGEAALESPSLESGLFTHGILDYLSNVSNGNHVEAEPRWIDFREMFVSAARRTSELARSHYQREQQPTVLRWMN